MAGNIVIGIDNSADTVVIPDSDNQDVTFASNVVCSSIKKIIVHSPDIFGLIRRFNTSAFASLECKIVNSNDILQVYFFTFLFTEGI